MQSYGFGRSKKIVVVLVVVVVVMKLVFLQCTSLPQLFNVMKLLFFSVVIWLRRE